MSKHDEENESKARIDGFTTLTYMMLSMQAKLNAQSKLLLEIADIITQKDPGEIRKEYFLDMIQQHREVMTKMTTDKATIDAIKKML